MQVLPGSTLRAPRTCCLPIWRHSEGQIRLLSFCVDLPAVPCLIKLMKGKSDHVNGFSQVNVRVCAADVALYSVVWYRKKVIILRY